jgi:hypothetical protein
MEWLKQHADTIVILGSFALCFWTLNEKMNDKFNSIEKDLAVIKAVMVMRNIMPNELCQHEQKLSPAP